MIYFVGFSKDCICVLFSIVLINNDLKISLFFLFITTTTVPKVIFEYFFLEKSLKSAFGLHKRRKNYFTKKSFH